MALGKLILRGIASVVVVVVFVTALTWLAINALRPDLRAGDDRFILVSLGDYLQRAFLHFDFGQSFTSRREVSDLIRQGLPADLSLLGGALVFGLVAGVAGGAYCAARPRTKGSRLLEATAAVCMCAPVYVVGLLVLLLFGAGLGMVGFLAHIPTAYVPFSDSPLGWAGALLMPWIVLGLPLYGVALRMMRASMTDVLDEDYLRTAMAKGLRPRAVVRRHAVPSAVAPVFSLMIVTMPVVVTNLVLIEQVYSIPGVFTGMRRGIATGDFDLLFGLTAVAAAFVAVAGLVAELALAWLDPRMRARAAQ
jgi:peptide/nickel transport system permease protein